MRGSLVRCMTCNLKAPGSSGTDFVEMSLGKTLQIPSLVLVNMAEVMLKAAKKKKKPLNQSIYIDFVINWKIHQFLYIHKRMVYLCRAYAQSHSNSGSEFVLCYGQSSKLPNGEAEMINSVFDIIPEQCGRDTTIYFGDIRSRDVDKMVDDDADDTCQISDSNCNRNRGQAHGCRVRLLFIT